MNCPCCDGDCISVVVGHDNFGKIYEWTCTECDWSEGDE